MKKIVFPLFTLLLGMSLYGQTTTDIGVWLDHLPYGDGVDVLEQNEKVYCATQQGLFIYDRKEETLNRLSKVNGLSDVGLTCLGWAPNQRLLLIGYENGNVDLVQGEDVVNVSDIKQSGNYTGLKRINHITVDGNIAYFCTDFGIVTYDLDRRIILETYIIGDEGNILGVSDLALTNDSIFAATPEGLMGANRSKPLIFFANWQRQKGLSAPINQVDNFQGRLFANRPGPAPIYDSIFYKENGQWKWAAQLPDSTRNLDIRVRGGYLCIANGSSARAYDQNFKLELNVQSQAIKNDNLTQKDFLYLKAAVIGKSPDFFWVISNDGLYGSIRYDGVNSYVKRIEPNSPTSKSVERMYYSGEKLFVAPGAISAVWAPLFNNDGYYTLQNYVWENHANSEINNYTDIVAFIADPNDPKKYYASSYGNGILKFEDGQYTGIINSASTGGILPTLANSSEHRIGGFSADQDGNIWFTNSNTDKPLGVLRPDGSVQAYSLGSLVTTKTDVKKILYTTQDQIWIQTRGDGVVVAQVVNGAITNNSLKKRLTATEGSGNLPTERVLTFAEDHDGEIWIGTDEGIAVLYSPQNIFEPERNYDAQIIVIDEDGDGNGERVLGSETVTDIEVDGSNKKWFATENSGVFYTSENGKEQIYHFNRENSPLPSDNVLDIAIDGTTGMVYFATDQGIVSFQGGATEGAESHEDVFAYPNPVEPGYEGPILIRGLVTNAQVKITDIEGNIVYETIAEGGQAIWSGKNFNGERAESGVYLAFITNDDGTATAVTKILIVR